MKKGKKKRTPIPWGEKKKEKIKFQKAMEEML